MTIADRHVSLVNGVRAGVNAANGDGQADAESPRRRLVRGIHVFAASNASDAGACARATARSWLESQKIASSSRRSFSSAGYAQ